MLSSFRPAMSQLTLNICVAVYFLAIFNTGFFEHFAVIFQGQALRGSLFLIAIFALTVLTLEFFGPGRLQKPAAVLLILVAAFASYFERAFGVLIDREMVRNVMQTTMTESKHLASLDAVVTIGVTGGLPSALVLWTRVSRVRNWHQFWRWPVGVGVSLAIMLGCLFADLKSFSAVLRERKELMASYQPGATIGAIARYGKQQWRTMKGPVEVRPVALDAAPGAHIQSVEKPVLLVLFVGETARAANFGLNGYESDTTPRLSKMDVINFPEAVSCGTSTAVSVPCMFSPLPQSGFSYENFIAQENLLDVVKRAGFDVKWVENNTGDQNVALRTGWSRVDATLAPEACTEECTDEAFLPIIEDTIATLEQNTVLVLHMIGNHGPAYFLRYGSDSARFLPDCRSIAFAECSVQEIVNAYDNAIVETDKVLSSTIEKLNASERILPAMIYFSDHGESLGENGLYLHAAPWFMAPDTQTHVPFVMWMSRRFEEGLGVDDDCVRNNARRKVSQDNLFHSVLGLLDITTKARDPELDLFGSCRA